MRVPRLVAVYFLVLISGLVIAAEPPERKRSDPPPIVSSWDDLLEGALPPIDRHEIIALIAPRPFLDLSGLNDGNPLTQRQRVLALLRIMDVYELEKTPQNFAFYVHGRGHSVAHESRELIFGWMDVHLKPASATQTRLLTAEPPSAKAP